MKIARLFRASLVAVALNLLVTFSGVSQGYVSFDSADSNPGAGIYSFLFSGVSLGMGAPYQLSDFTLSGFSAAGNTQTLGFVSGPTAWPMISSDTDMMHYQVSPFFTDLNGVLKISATPDISGSVTWSFGFFVQPGYPIPSPISGTVSIGSVPEPSSVDLIIVASSLLIIRRLYSTMWPNKSPEPTAVGAGSSAVAVHVASRRWLSFLR